MDQRVQQVGAEADANDQADDGLNHSDDPSKPVAGDGIGAHQPEEQKSECKVDKIGHGATPPD
jgi:hypothetical protein